MVTCAPTCIKCLAHTKDVCLRGHAIWASKHNLEVVEPVAEQHRQAPFAVNSECQGLSWAISGYPIPLLLRSL